MARDIVRYILEFIWQNLAFRTVLLTVTYTVTLALCFWTSYQVRFDFHAPLGVDESLFTVAAIAIAAKLVALFFFRQFDGRLTYFGKPDLNRLAIACTVGSLPLATMSLVRAFGSVPPRA